jgi:hypothetical protein
MALVTILKFVITWFLGNIFFILLTPILKTMLYDSGMWNLLPANILIWGDTLYVFWIAMVIIIPAVILIKAWREAEQRAVEG